MCSSGKANAILYPVTEMLLISVGTAPGTTENSRQKKPSLLKVRMSRMKAGPRTCSSFALRATQSAHKLMRMARQLRILSTGISTFSLRGVVDGSCALQSSHGDLDPE